MNNLKQAIEILDRENTPQEYAKALQLLKESAAKHSFSHWIRNRRVKRRKLQDAAYITQAVLLGVIHNASCLHEYGFLFKTALSLLVAKAYAAVAWLW